MLVNSIVKAIEKEEDVLVAFKLDIEDNVDISKPKSTVSEMKSLIATMLKFLEKDEAAASEISFKLRIESK